MCYWKKLLFSNTSIVLIHTYEFSGILSYFSHKGQPIQAVLRRGMEEKSMAIQRFGILESKFCDSQYFLRIQAIETPELSV